MRFPRTLFWFCLAGLILLRGDVTVEAAEPPVPALEDPLEDLLKTDAFDRPVIALTGAKILVAPGTVLEDATLIIRAGRVAAVGVGIALPPEATVRDLKGRVIYPGFIDAYTSLSGEPSETTLATPPEKNGDAGREGAADRDRDRDSIHPLLSTAVDAHRRVVSVPERHGLLRRQGFVARLAVPGAGIVRGTSALIATDDAGRAPTVLASRVAMHAHLYVPRSPRRTSYPNSPMGAVALARQAFHDADWLRIAEASEAVDGSRSERDASAGRWNSRAWMSVAWQETHEKLGPYLRRP